MHFYHNSWLYVDSNLYTQSFNKKKKMSWFDFYFDYNSSNTFCPYVFILDLYILVLQFVGRSHFIVFWFDVLVFFYYSNNYIHHSHSAILPLSLFLFLVRFSFFLRSNKTETIECRRKEEEKKRKGHTMVNCKEKFDKYYVHFLFFFLVNVLWNLFIQLLINFIYIYIYLYAFLIL